MIFSKKIRKIVLASILLLIIFLISTYQITKIEPYGIIETINNNQYKLLKMGDITFQSTKERMITITYEYSGDLKDKKTLESNARDIASDILSKKKLDGFTYIGIEAYKPRKSILGLVDYGKSYRIQLKISELDLESDSGEF